MKLVKMQTDSNNKSLKIDVLRKSHTNVSPPKNLHLETDENIMSSSHNSIVTPFSPKIQAGSARK